jgi:hypothetical protein
VVKDICYASLFDKQDLPYLYRLAEEVRATHNQDLVNDFNLKCQKKWDDHNPVLEVGNRNIEFLQVSKADDLVVTTGINRFIDQVLGASTVYWQYMGCGTGSTAPTAADIAMQTTIGFFIDTLIAGWREYAGTSLRFASIWGDSIATTTVNECGVFTPTGAVMLNRDVFSNNPLVHTINISAFVLSCIIEFVPVM